MHIIPNAGNKARHATTMDNLTYTFTIAPLVSALVLFFGAWAKAELTSYRHKQRIAARRARLAKDRGAI